MYRSELAIAVRQAFACPSFRDDPDNTAFTAIDVTLLPEYWEYIQQEYLRVAQHMRAGRELP
jgi:hypothetical protein